MDITAHMTGVSTWPVLPADPAMVVHLPDGSAVARFSDQRRHVERQRVFGEKSTQFWDWQEQTAEAIWELALQMPEWPPQTPRQALSLMRKGISWLWRDPGRRLNPTLFGDAFRPAASHLKNMPAALREFIDAQLLISAQTDSQAANALYAASALDLPRRGVVHVRGGIGALAGELVKSIRTHGGQVFFRKEVVRICAERQQVMSVETRRGERFLAEIVVANLTPWDLKRILITPESQLFKRLPPQPQTGWGAFMLYLGVDSSVIPPDLALHHQVIQSPPLGEGRSVFLSISPAWDAQRAPQGKRAITLSTHTRFDPWWDMAQNDRSAYERTRQVYTDRLISLASRAVPGLRDASELILPGTPVTFERFTRRARGWVGGFPQVNLFQGLGPRIAPGVWMVGDSIFPGQSVAAVSLGALRVAQDILSSLP